MDWLVVRFGGERDGVKGQHGAWFARPSNEYSPLPLKFKVTGEHTTLSRSWLTLCLCHKDHVAISFSSLRGPSDMPH